MSTVAKDLTEDILNEIIATIGGKYPRDLSILLALALRAERSRQNTKLMFL